MASITLIIPDAELPRVRVALCSQAGLPDSNVNAKQAVINIVKDIVRAYEYNIAVVAQPAIPVPDVTAIVA